MSRKKSHELNGEKFDATGLPSLPAGWCWTTLETVAQIDGGLTKDQKRKQNSTSREVPYLRVANVQRGHLDLTEVKKIIADENEINSLRLRSGDILFTEGGDRDKLGRGWVWSDEIRECIHQNHIFRARLRTADISPKFVSYHGNSFGQAWFSKTGKQTTNLASINKGVLRNFPVPLAPADEQRRIVAKIEELFSDLDAGVAALERAKANLKRYRASVLKAAVEGKLTEAWRAEHPNTEPASKLLERILSERRQKWEADQLAKFAAAHKEPPKNWKAKYIEPSPLDTTGLPELPDGWCWASVEQVADSVRYGSSAKTNEDATGIPVLRMGNIVDGELDFTSLKYLPKDHPEFPDLLLEKGDLLFNRTNSAELVGKSAVYQGQYEFCSYASYLILVRTIASCAPHFLCMYINSAHGRRWVKSVVSQQVGQANVNGTKLQALTFPLPPLAEQCRIVVEVTEKFSQIDAAAREIEHGLIRASRLRQSILKRAFEGKIVPQDPTEEPASVLLERLKKNRNQNRIGTRPRTRLLKPTKD